MRLGFNWNKGPFEMLEEIGVNNFFDKIENYKGNKFLEDLAVTKNEKFHGVRQKYTDIETLGKVKKQLLVLMEIVQQKFIDLKIIILSNLQLRLMHLIIIQWML